MTGRDHELDASHGAWGMQELGFGGALHDHGLVRLPEGRKSEQLVDENLWFVNPLPR